MSTRAERIVKLQRMAAQSVSPKEADIARAKLQEMGEEVPGPDWVEPPQYGSTSFASPMYGTPRGWTYTPDPAKTAKHEDDGPFNPTAHGKRTEGAAFMDAFMLNEMAKGLGATGWRRADNEQPEGPRFNVFGARIGGDAAKRKVDRGPFPGPDET